MAIQDAVKERFATFGRMFDTNKKLRNGGKLTEGEKRQSMKDAFSFDVLMALLK
jgi:hypothetical protein